MSTALTISGLYKGVSEEYCGVVLCNPVESDQGLKGYIEWFSWYETLMKNH
jgi:hypothetical protein